MSEKQYQMKDGDISVFPNDKGDNPRRPDYTGKALISGKEFSVALWAKDGGRLSGKISYSPTEQEKAHSIIQTASRINDMSEPRQEAVQYNDPGDGDLPF